MNTFGCIFLGVLKSSFYATSSTTLHACFTHKTYINETSFHEIDEGVKSSQRVLHSRVMYIFASLLIKRSV
jgi:hypothetical protein